MQIYNSRDKSYKSIISAIATNEKCKFRIIVPRDMKCCGACLAITKENEQTAYYNMFWAGMCGENFEYWELHFYATTPGLYFYHFVLDTPWGKSYIKNAGEGRGELNAFLPDFQQTVYDENFVTPDFLKGGIMYQIFPDRFFKSNQEKKNVPTTCIYLNPIFESHSNHRYDTADYEKVDSLLGDENDLKSLCKKSKEKYGISIILDGVFSHTGCDSRYFNMYNHYNDVGAYNSKQSPYYSWYKFIKWPDDYHSWWGIKLLPEVIEEDESYRNYICGKNGILKKWLKCGIAGYRLDVADELPDIFLDDLRKSVKSENPNAIIIGEVWEDATNKFAYGQRRKYLLGEELDSVMNYPFADAVLDFVRFANGDSFFNSVMSIVENYPPQVLSVLMNHIGTHDTVRAITRLAGENPDGHDRTWQFEHNTLSKFDYLRGVSMMKIASLIQFTLPGVPSIYYGDEIGMQGMKDPFNRGCMAWDDANDELLKWYKRLGQIRHSSKAFINGDFEKVYCDGGVIAYSRNCESDSVLVAINNSNESKKIFVGTQWDNSYSLFDEICVDGFITLPPYRYTLLSKQNK